MGPATEQAQSGVFLGGRRGQAGRPGQPIRRFNSFLAMLPALFSTQPGLAVPSSRPITWYLVRHQLRSILMSLVASTVAQ